MVQAVGMYDKLICNQFNIVMSRPQNDKEKWLVCPTIK